MESKEVKLKNKRKYASNLRQMAFGGNADEEVLVEQWTFDSNGNLVENRKWEDGGSCEINTYEYDEHGRLMMHTLVLEPFDSTEKTEYVRDEQGRVLSETKFYGDDAGERVEYLYNRHSNPITIKRYDADGLLESTEQLELDENGDVLIHHKFDADGAIVEKSEVNYAAPGKPSGKIVTSSDTNTIGKTDIIYNDLGKVIRATELTPQGTVLSEVVSEYDERGNVVVRRVRDFNTRLLRFEYDSLDRVLTEEIFDEHGNMVMRNTMDYDDNGFLTSETEFWSDTGRGTSHKNTVSRFEYDFHD
ncbi:MAG: hypothetical protein ACU4F9_00600 [Arcticibacter sp.]